MTALANGRTFEKRAANGNSGSGPAIGFSIQHGEIVHCSELTDLGQVRPVNSRRSTSALR